MRRYASIKIMGAVVAVPILGFITLRFIYAAPSTEDLVSKFVSTRGEYETLRKMIVEDTGERSCFEVGLDHIGDYWEFSDTWTHRHDYETKLTLSEVLDSVGLTAKRFDDYRQLFAATGSERVGFCHSGPGDPWGRVLVYGAGLAVSGCIAWIGWSDSLPESYGTRDGDFAEITPISGDWYLQFECT